MSCEAAGTLHASAHELAGLQHQACATLQVDLMKAYEHVDYATLLQQVRIHGFPLRVALLAITIYM
eukprot:3695003-Amphidinium_carterae.1